MSIKCVTLLDNDVDRILLILSSFAKQSFQKDELINFENIIDTYYNASIEGGIAPLTALSFMQLTPSIMLQVISGNQELLLQQRGKGFSLDNLGKLVEEFSDFNKVVEYFKIDPSTLSRKQKKKLKRNNAGNSIDEKSRVTNVIFDAKPQDVASTITRPHLFAALSSQQGILDKENTFYKNLKKAFALALNKSDNLSMSDLTFGGHTGFKITLMSQTMLRKEDLRPEHLRRITDKEHIDYKWDYKLKKDVVQKKQTLAQRKVDYQNGISAVITDNNGNILYFKEDDSGNYNVVSAEEGIASYDNVRRTFGNKENFYRGLASFQDVAKKTGESVKEVKKRFDADWKAVDDAIKYIQSDKKNNKVITEITTVNPGHAVVNYEEKVPLSEINFNETLPFDIEIEKVGENKGKAVIKVSDPFTPNIPIDYLLLKDTKYADFIKELLLNDDLDIKALERIKLIKQYTYISDYKYSYDKKNPKELIVKNKKGDVYTKKQLKKDIEKKIEGYKYPITDKNKEKIEKSFVLQLNLDSRSLGTKINDIISIENNKVETQEKDYNDFVKENFSSPFVVNAEGQVPLLGGYYTFSVSDLNNLKRNKRIIKGNTSLKNSSAANSIVILDQIVARSKNFIISPDKKKYIQLDENRNIIRTYNRVTDVTSESSDTLDNLREVEKQDAFVFNDDGTISIDRDILEEKNSYLLNLLDDPIDKNNNTEEDAILRIKTGAVIGITFDEIFRDYFSEDGSKSYKDFIANSEFKKNAIKRSMYYDAIDAIETWAEENISKDEKVYAEGMLVYNDELGIAGTLDLLTINKKTGEIKIWDMKTKRAGSRFFDSGFEGGESDASKFSKQLSTYNILLNNTDGLSASELLIIPIKAASEKGEYTTYPSEFSGIEEPYKLKKLEKIPNLKVTPTSEVKQVYQGYDTLTDRKFNYFTVNKSEAKDYGKNVRTVTLNIKDLLKGNSKLYKDLKQEDSKNTGEIFDLLDNSKKGKEKQNQFFDFLHKKGYKGIDFTMFSDSQYIVSFENLEVKPTQTHGSTLNSNAIVTPVKGGTVTILEDAFTDKQSEDYINKVENLLATEQNKESNFDNEVKQVAVVYGPKEYSYAKGGKDSQGNKRMAIHNIKAIPKWMQELSRKVEKDLGKPAGYYNHVLINRYGDNVGIGTHTDAESIYDNEKGEVGSVAIYSIGHTKNKHKIGGVDFQATHNSLAEMSTGKLSHSVGKAKGTRYSINFRHIPSSQLPAQSNEVELKKEPEKNNTGFNSTDDLSEELYRTKPAGETQRAETKRQQKRAKQWYDSNPMSKYLPYEIISNIVNSNIYAQFTVDGITLHDGFNYTDLYHESWHGFTQLFLTPEEKSELYNEVKKDTGTFVTYKGVTKKFSEANDKEIEEYLAEDYRAYGLSGGKITKKDSPKRNNIFSRIFNFLKSLFTNTSYESAIVRPEILNSVRKLQKELYNGDFEQRNYSINNVKWGKLNYGIESLNENVENLDIQKSRVLMKSIDSFISTFINMRIDQDKNTKWSSAWHTAPEFFYKHAYQFALYKFTELRETADTEYKKELLDYAISQWGDISDLGSTKGVAAYHRNNSKYTGSLTDSLDAEAVKDLISVNTENQQWQQVIEGSSNKLSTIQSASKQILFLIKSLHKYNEDGSPKLNQIDVHELSEFNRTWSRLLKTLESIEHPEEMYDALKKASKADANVAGTINELLKKLGDPNLAKADSEVDIWTDFWQVFNKSRVPLEQITVKLNTKKEIKSESGKKDYESILEYELTSGAAHGNLQKIRANFSSFFKSIKRDPNKYITEIKIKGRGKVPVLKTGENTKFRRTYPDYYAAQKNPFTFLKNIGFNLDNNNLLINEINNKEKYKESIKYIYTALIDKKRKGLIFDIIKDLSSETARVTEILNAESKFSDKYSNFSVNNANNDLQNEHTYNGTVNRIVNAINKSKTYSELVSRPYMSFLDFRNNPSVLSNGILNSIFDIGNGEGPKLIDKTTKKEIVLKLTNLSGVAKVKDEILDKSNVTADLTDNDKLIQDIHDTLIRGNPEFPRHASKSTALAASPSRVKNSGQNKHVYVDSVEFSEDYEKTIKFYDGKNFSEVVTNDGTVKTINKIIDHIIADIKKIEIIKKGGQPEVLGYTVGTNKIKAKGTELYTFKGMISDDLYSAIQYDIIGEYDVLDEYDTVEEFLDADYDENWSLRDWLTMDLNDYLNNVYEQTYEKFNEMPFISKSLEDKISKELGQYTDEELSKEQMAEIIVSSYVANQMLNKFDLMTIFYGDPSQYNMLKEDFHKRNAAMASAGQIFRTDQAMYNWINNVFTAPNTSNPTRNTTYTQSLGLMSNVLLYFNGKLNTIVLKENEIESAYAENYEKAFRKYYIERYKNLKLSKTVKDDMINNAVQSAIKPYLKMEEGDGQGYLTFDAYRILGKLQGKWSKKQEELFQKIINKEDVSKYNLSEFFPVRKYQYFGPLATTNSVPLTGFHKYSLMPLIPNVIEGTNLEKLHNKMTRENITYATYGSGSKISTITENGENSLLYKGDIKPTESREFNEESKFISNPIYLEYLKDQIDIHPEFKRKATFSTQFRKLVELNIFEKGRAISKKMKAFATTYENLLEQKIESTKKEILRESGYTLGSEDVSGLVEMVARQLKARDLAAHELDFINVDYNGEIVTDLSLSLNAPQIEKMLMALVNNKLIKSKLNGEMLVLVSNSGFESSQFTNATELDKETYGTDGLASYQENANNGMTSAMKIKIALQGDFTKLLNLTDLKGDKIRTRERLNKVIKNEDWLNKDDNRRMITMVGVRIPVQGLNSMEFMEVGEFLPESAGNIIIPPSEMVAKSGSDFDVDKLSIYMPNLTVINGKTELIKNLDVTENKEDLENKIDFIKDQIKEKRNNWRKSKWKERKKKLSPELQIEFQEKEETFRQESKVDRKLKKQLLTTWNELYTQSLKVKGTYVTNKLDETRNAINEVENRLEALEQFYLTEEYEIFNKEEKNILKPLYEKLAENKRKLNSVGSKGIDNDTIKVIREILEQPENFIDLVLPLGNASLEALADKMAQSPAGKKKYSQYQQLNTDEGESDVLEVARIFEPIYNLYKHSSNAIGKAVLGLYAVNNTFNSVYNRMGAYINDIDFNTKVIPGSSTKGKGTAEGDAKDAAMRKDANGFIGEIRKEDSSSNTSLNKIKEKINLEEVDENEDSKNILNDETSVVMLARNASFKNVDLSEYTKEKIDEQHKRGVTFIVGDMPGVDERFIEYLQLIDAKFTVYHTGDKPRIRQKVKLKLSHNKFLKNKKEYISLSNVYDVNGTTKISDTNSQLINGAVDVEKKAWLFDINAGIENAPLLTLLTESGVPEEKAVYFISNPYVVDYIKQVRIKKSVFYELSQAYLTKQSEEASKSPFGLRLINIKAEEAVILNPLNKFPKGFNTSKKNFNFNSFKIANTEIEKYEKEIDNIEILKDIAMNGIDDNNREVAQAAFYHYLKLRAPSNEMTQIKTNLTYDTKKSISLYAAFEREKAKLGLLNLKYFDSNLISKIIDTSIIGLYDISEFSLKYLSNLFELRNHPDINNHLSNEIASGSVPLKKMGMTNDVDGKERFVNIFKNDLVSFMFQNKIRESFLPKIVDGKLVLSGLKVEKDLKIEYVQNLKQGVAIKDDVIYVNSNKLNSDFLDAKKDPKIGRYITSFDDYFEFALQKELLKSSTTAEDLYDDKYFTDLYDEYVAEEETEKKKESLKKVYDFYLNQKTLDNIYNKQKLFKSTNTYAVRLSEILDKHPDLINQYEILSNLVIDKGNYVTNLKYNEKIDDGETFENYYLNVSELMDPNIKKVENEEDNKMITEFFKDFPFFAFFQTGQDINSPLSLVRGVPNEKILEVLKSAHKDVIDMFNDKTYDGRMKSAEYLDSFTKSLINKYEDQNQKAWRFKNWTEKTSNLKETLTDINNIYVNNPSIQLINTSRKNGAYINSLIEKTENTNELIVLPIQNENFYLNNKAYKIKSKNYVDGNLGIILNDIQNDENFEFNKENIDTDIDYYVTEMNNGNKLLFLSSGYGENLYKKAPKTYQYLSKKLYENFGYINPKSIENSVITDNINNSQNITNKMLEDNIENSINQILEIFDQNC